MDNLLDFEPVNEIICKIRVKLKYYTYFILPTSALYNNTLQINTYNG